MGADETIKPFDAEKLSSEAYLSYLTNGEKAFILKNKGNLEGIASILQGVVRRSINGLGFRVNAEQVTSQTKIFVKFLSELINDEEKFSEVFGSLNKVEAP